MKKDTDSTDEAERDIARLLEAAGAREELPADLRSRWEQHLRAELAAKAPQRRRLAMPLAALAASVMVLLLVLDGMVGTPESALPIQVRAVAGSPEVELGESRRVAVIAGQKLFAGATVVTGATGVLALDWAGFDVRVNSGTRLVLEDHHLQLEAGEIFVNNRNRRTLLRQALVKTALGSVRDIGTQFKVRVSDGLLVASVRQGSVLLDTGAGEYRADAKPGAGQMLRVEAGADVSTVKDDSDWRWIYPVAGTFKLEGRTVQEFLAWSAVESGSALQYANESVELAARSTRFSGSVDITSLDPDEAVKVVLSTTRFVAEKKPGELVISRRLE